MATERHNSEWRSVFVATYSNGAHDGGWYDEGGPQTTRKHNSVHERLHLCGSREKTRRERIETWKVGCVLGCVFWKLLGLGTAFQISGVGEECSRGAEVPRGRARAASSINHNFYRFYICEIVNGSGRMFFFIVPKLITLSCLLSGIFADAPDARRSTAYWVFDFQNSLAIYLKKSQS